MRYFITFAMFCCCAFLLIGCGNKDENEDEGLPEISGSMPNTLTMEQKLKKEEEAKKPKPRVVDILGTVPASLDTMVAENPPKINIDLPEKEEVLPEIENDTDRIQILNRQSAGIDTAPFKKFYDRKIQILLNEEPGTLVSKLPKDKIYKWVPKKRSDGTNMGLPWLQCATISNDQSLLVVVEKIGKSTGPFGSRVVFISLFDFVVRNVWETKNIIRQISIDETRNSVFVLTEAQRQLRQDATISELDLISGATVQTLVIPKENQVVQFEHSEPLQKILFAYENNPGLKITSTAQFSHLRTREIKLKSPNFIAAFSPKDKSVAVFADNMITDYDVDRLHPVQTRNVVTAVNPKKIMNLGSSNLWAVLAPSAKLINNEMVIDFFDDCANFAFKQGNRVYLSNEVTQEITGFDIVPFKPVETIPYRKLDPRSRISPFFVGYSRLGSRVIYLDKSGALYILFKPQGKSNYLKAQIFDAEK